MQDQTNILLKPAEMRRQLGGISEVTEWRWVGRGIISPVKINGRNFYKQSDVVRLISQGESGGC